MNNLRTTLLLSILTALFLVFGFLLGGKPGMIIAFIFAVVMNFGSYWFSDKIVLRSYGAQPLTQQDAPELYSMVQDLARRAHIPMPKLYLVDDPNPNAFATGRNPENAAVAVTTGILHILDMNELRGVLAHELSHVLHKDTLTSAIAATLAGAIAMLANIAQWGMLFSHRESEENSHGGLIGSILMMILAPIAATIIQLAISRSREFAADAKGAELCGDPTPLAKALQKLEAGNEQIPSDAHPASAHMMIINPLRGGGFSQLFSTHPSTEERIKRLMAMRRY